MQCRWQCKILDNAPGDRSRGTKKKSFETEIISKENFEMSNVFSIFVGQLNYFTIKH